MNLYDFLDYKKYLKFRLGREKQRTGAKSKAAQFIGCQTAYLSQVLNGHAQLSLEQAQKMSEFLSHAPEETHFLLLLVQFQRAGTKELEVYFKNQLDEILDQRQKIKSRVDVNREMSELQKNKYYSSWVYAAVHIALSIPELQNPQKISQYLEIELNRTYEILNFLKESGLAIQEEGIYKIGPSHVHLGNDEDNILKHHSNWRLKALQGLDRGRSQIVNYAVTYSVAKSDVQKIKNKLLDVIQENMKIVAPSKEEVLMCNIIDFFELGSADKIL